MPGEILWRGRPADRAIRGCARRWCSRSPCCCAARSRPTSTTRCGRAACRPRSRPDRAGPGALAGPARRARRPARRACCRAASSSAWRWSGPWPSSPRSCSSTSPRASLDPASTLAVEELIARAHAGGTEIVLVTHDLGQARRLADEVVFLHRGRVPSRPRPPDFFAEPASQPARAYLAGQIVI